ncbi:MAG: RIP metalloprotease [Rubrobacteraceae bacterium]
MTLVIAVLGLIFLIVIHELGHMLTAKALGVQVDEFGVGFGPALFKRKIGQTIYSFRIILLGGFAKMAGMEDIGSVAQQRGELGPDTYPGKPPWRRALIIFAGPMANLLAAIAILAGVYMFAGVQEATTEVDRVTGDSLAAEVGVKPGDELVALDGVRFQNWQGFTEAVTARNPGDEVTLTVERNGSGQQFSGELGANPDNRDQAMVGVSPVVETEALGPLAATGLAVQRVVEITGMLAVFIGQLVTGEQDFYENVTGPVGIATVSSESIAGGFFLPLLAFISLNLAIFNLLPILPLDGGHLLLIAIEKVIGRPVSQQTMGKIAFVGLALILTLFLFATYADVSKLIQGQPFIPE